jgi:hypothetical protein
LLNAVSNGSIATHASAEKSNGGTRPATSKPLSAAAAIRIHPEPFLIPRASPDSGAWSTANQSFPPAEVSGRAIHGRDSPPPQA